MNRRRFLATLGTAVGLAASWRIGYDNPLSASVPIPANADALERKASSWVSIAQYQRDPDVEFYAAWAFSDPLRNLAFYAMYATHVAKPYGSAPAVQSLAEFMALDRAHCGDYPIAQQELCRAFGLTTRHRIFADGSHGWLEVVINGRWEIFDATVNCWINQPMDALLRGEPRQYQMFYAPCLDVNAPEVYRAHLSEGYNVPRLRARLPFFGLELNTHFAELETI